MTADRDRLPCWRQIFQPDHSCAAFLKLLRYLHSPGQAAANTRSEYLNQPPLLKATNARQRHGSQQICQMCWSHVVSLTEPCQPWALANSHFFKQGPALELSMQRRLFSRKTPGFSYLFWPAQSLFTSCLKRAGKIIISNTGLIIWLLLTFLWWSLLRYQKMPFVTIDNLFYVCWQQVKVEFSY